MFRNPIYINNRGFLENNFCYSFFLKDSLQLCNLCCSESGLQELSQNNIRRSNISKNQLNATLKPIGTSLLFLLCCSPTGRNILKNDSDLRNKITDEGLNSVIIDDPKPNKEILSKDRDEILAFLNGKYKGVNPLFMLARTHDGRELLLSDPELRNKILPIYPIGRTARLLKETENGRKIISADQRLREMFFDDMKRNYITKHEFKEYRRNLAADADPNASSFWHKAKRIIKDKKEEIMDPGNYYSLK